MRVGSGGGGGGDGGGGGGGGGAGGDDDGGGGGGVGDGAGGGDAGGVGCDEHGGGQRGGTLRVYTLRCVGGFSGLAFGDDADAACFESIVMRQPAAAAIPNPDANPGPWTPSPTLPLPLPLTSSPLPGRRGDPVARRRGLPPAQFRAGAGAGEGRRPGDDGTVVRSRQRSERVGEKGLTWPRTTVAATQPGVV